jgi:diguanylate cyclase (GGDEF)-like protein
MRIEDRVTVSDAARAYARARTERAGSAPSQPAPSGLDRPALSVLGIPESELTPAVHQAMGRLLDEVGQLHQQVAELRDRLANAQSLADEDPLVPLRNRRSFVRELERMIAYGERHGHDISLLMLDVDGLKPINDTGGHAAGDEAIKQVAAAIIESTRDSDLLGRLGGDEFGVVLMDMDRGGAETIRQRINEAVAARSVVLPDGPRALSVSIGVCTFRPGMTLQEAMAVADETMYRQKAGRARH